MTAPATDSLVMTEQINASPDVVFDYLVDPEKLLRWMGTEADIDPQPGGKFWLNVNGNDIAVGNYVEVDRPNKVVFTWGWHGSPHVPPGSSTVTVTLRPEGDSTLVELEHAGLPGGAGDQHREGWAHFLPQLAAAADNK